MPAPTGWPALTEFTNALSLGERPAASRTVLREQVGSAGKRPASKQADISNVADGSLPGPAAVCHRVPIFAVLKVAPRDGSLWLLPYVLGVAAFFCSASAIFCTLGP